MSGTPNDCDNLANEKTDDANAASALYRREFKRAPCAPPARPRLWLSFRSLVAALRAMPFLHAIQQRLNQYAPGTAERLILDFLLRYGVGRHNAQPWGAIEVHLQKHGIQIRLQTFQQGLLKESREGDMY